MTEKRFNLVDLLETLAIADGDECKYYQNCNDDFMSLCKELNALHEENQKLDKTIEELDNCQKGQSHRINDLYLENKQLKDLITHLGYTIKYDGYRHISLELRE